MSAFQAEDRGSIPLHCSIFLGSSVGRARGCVKYLSGGYTLKEGDKRICEICGKEYEIVDNGWTRRYCYECSPQVTKTFTRADNITAKRRAIKIALIKEAGGKCQRCGYNKCMRALEFHHVDPSTKDFGISRQLNKDMSELREEVSKCILLCSNCHAEVHDELFQQGYSQFNPDI